MYIFLEKKRLKLFANSADPDQMPHSVASDRGLHYFCNGLFVPNQLVNAVVTVFVLYEIC